MSQSETKKQQSVVECIVLHTSRLDKMIVIVISAERFALLQRAKEVLTDDENRKSYDAWRRCGVAVSFKEWCARKECIKTVRISQRGIK